MGLQDAADRVAQGYSLGMKQRLGLARTLLHKPEFIILDEPTNGLDPAGIKEIRETIKKLNREEGITFLVSSHILPEVEQMAKRVGIIHAGQLVEEITMEDLREKGKKYLKLKATNPEVALKTLQEKLKIAKLTVGEDGTIYVFEELDRPELLNRTLNENGIYISHFTLHQIGRASCRERV